MPHFVIFCDDRLDGVQRYLDRYNLTDNTLELCVGEDLTTQELGGRAFAHHLLYPEDWLVVVPSPLDLFTWDEEVGLYLPLFSSAEAAIAAYGQWFDGIIINLLAHPAPSRIIITDLVGFDSVFWEHTPGDTVMQDWVDQVVVGVQRRLTVSTVGWSPPSFPSDPRSTSHAGPWTVYCTSMIIEHFTTDSSPGAGN